MKKTLNVLMGFFTLCFFVLGIDGVWAADGAQKWAFKTGDKVKSSPAIGSDGIVYVGSEDGHLYAINPDGTQKWVFKNWPLDSSPAIGSDGTIYVGSGAGLYAINPDGTQKWNALAIDGSVYSCPAIGSDGTIYFGLADNNALCAVNPDGTSKWCFPTGSPVYTSPAIGPDGTIYVQAVSNLYAIDPNGNQKWVFKTDGMDSSPAIGSDGTIYVGSLLNLYAMNPDGTQKWAFKTEGFGMESSPAIGADGMIYVLGGSDGNLYAINPDGTQKWAFKTGGGSKSSPAIGADGTIYMGSEDKNVYAVNPDGTHKWVFKTGNVVDSSPAIGSDGTVYVGSDDDNIYAINGTSGGLAHTGWPMFHRDLRHTGFNSLSSIPDIKANGHDGSITVSPTAPVSITVSLNAGSFAGQNGDWWLVKATPSGTLHYFDLGTGSMTAGFLPTYQGPLFHLGATQLSNFSVLTMGTHTFYFGVDLNMNGVLDMDSIFYDRVNVIVQ